MPLTRLSYIHLLGVALSFAGSRRHRRAGGTLFATFCLWAVLRTADKKQRAARLCWRAAR